MKHIAKKTLFFFLFFLVFSLLINSIYLAVIVTLDWDFQKRIESLNFDNPDFRLLVLGSSLAEYGIDAELLTTKGINSFNLALTGNDIKTGYIQLNEYLDKYPKRPEYVVLAVNAKTEIFDQTGIHPVVEFTMKDQEYSINDVPLSKFRWQGTDLLKRAFSEEYREREVHNGQIRSFGMLPDNSKFVKENLNLEKYETAYWIGEIAKQCTDNWIELIIIEIPCVRETQNQSDIGPYNIDFNNGYSAKLFNLNSQDFCAFIDSDKDWVGLSHFNKFGAVKFTEKLISITQIGNFSKINNSKVKPE